VGYFSSQKFETITGVTLFASNSSFFDSVCKTGFWFWFGFGFLLLLLFFLMILGELNSWICAC
jgi:hypothetical protein